MPLEDYNVISCDIKKRSSHTTCDMRRRVITRVTTSVRSCLAAKTSSGTANSIPFRYNRRSCHCLPVSIKRDIRIPLIAFKPGQQCLSEAIFHLRLHIPLSLGTLAQNESSHFTLLHIHKRNRFIICVQKSPPGISL